MTLSQAKLSDLFAGIRAIYIGKLPEKLARIDSLWREAAAGVHPPDEELLRTVHSIAGSAATFGLPAVGEAALQLELALRPLCDRGSAPQDGESAQIEPLLAQLHRAAAHRTPERS